MEKEQIESQCFECTSITFCYCCFDEGFGKTSRTNKQDSICKQLYQTFTGIRIDTNEIFRKSASSCTKIHVDRNRKNVIGKNKYKLSAIEYLISQWRKATQ